MTIFFKPSFYRVFFLSGVLLDLDRWVHILVAVFVLWFSAIGSNFIERTGSIAGSIAFFLSFLFYYFTRRFMCCSLGACVCVCVSRFVFRFT